MRALGGRTRLVAQVVLALTVGLAQPDHAQSQPESEPAQALVYGENPVQTPQPGLRPLSLPTPRGRLEHAWLVAQSCVERGRTVTLAGSPKRQLRVCTPQSSARADAQGNFVAAPLPPGASASQADPFAEAMLFHHAGRTLTHLYALGLAPRTRPLYLVANVRLPAALFHAQASAKDAPVPWGDALFLADAERAAPLFQAMRTARADTIWFGETGQERFAYDGDVIAHEVVHAALESSLPGRGLFVDEQGVNTSHAALDEGLADYFAAVLNAGPVLGEHAAQSAQAWELRSIDAQPRCPEAWVGRSRPDSLLVSSTLWELRKALGEQGPLLDRALIAGIQQLAGQARLPVERLLQVVLAALAHDQPAAASRGERVFEARGLLPACQRVRTLEPAQSLSGEGGSFVAPGTRALPGASLAPGVVQLHVQLPQGTSALRLRMRCAAAARSPLFGAPENDSFQPLLLAKANGPIRWGADGTHDAAQRVAVSVGRLCTATLPVGGARQLWLQVVNQGAGDGSYDELGVAFEGGAPTADALMPADAAMVDATRAQEPQGPATPPKALPTKKPTEARRGAWVGGGIALLLAAAVLAWLRRRGR